MWSTVRRTVQLFNFDKTEPAEGLKLQVHMALPHREKHETARSTVPGMSWLSQEFCGNNVLYYLYHFGFISPNKGDN